MGLQLGLMEDLEYSTLVELLKINAARRPSTAAILASGREVLTYAGLYSLVETTVADLNRLGVSRNDRLAIVLPNGPEMATVFLAVAGGVTSAPLNPAYGESEFDFYLSDLDARPVDPGGMDSPARQATMAQPWYEPVPQLQAGGVFSCLAGIAPAYQVCDASVWRSCCTPQPTARPKWCH
jgi:non-ribosomal peptide synthetase component E (peptide arylation enzyme)